MAAWGSFFKKLPPPLDILQPLAGPQVTEHPLAVDERFLAGIEGKVITSSDETPAPSPSTLVGMFMVVGRVVISCAC